MARTWDESPWYIHPVLGYPLDKAAKIIARINMMFSIACFFLALLFHTILIVSIDDIRAQAIKNDKSLENMRIILQGVPLLLTFVNVLALGVSILFFFLGKFLYDSVKEESYKKVNIWCKITAVLFLLGTVTNISLVVIFSRGVSVFSFDVLQFFYVCYSLWIVYEYQKQLERSANAEARDNIGFNRI